MLTDQELIQISHEIDDFLSILATKYSVAPLSLSAITLARLMRLVEESDSHGDFKKIMSSAIGMGKKADRVLQ